MEAGVASKLSAVVKVSWFTNSSFVHCGTAAHIKTSYRVKISPDNHRDNVIHTHFQNNR